MHQQEGSPNRFYVISSARDWIKRTYTGMQLVEDMLTHREEKFLGKIKRKCENQLKARSFVGSTALIDLHTLAARLSSFYILS
jgi:hypothetical protein